jgi:carboxypeptidase Q
VVFNYNWTDYYSASAIRVDGPSKCAKHGAVAMLLRSIASQSVYSVHTGYMEYDPNYAKIPAAAITVEDADMIERMIQRQQRVTLMLNISTSFRSNCSSSNLIFELKGTTMPDKILLMGGHIDSWDTGSQTGANDDGGGVLTVYEAMRLLLGTGLRPQRTLRFIAWSGEESGQINTGAEQYVDRHRAEIDNHVLAFESDLGSTQLLGFGLSGKGLEVLRNVSEQYLGVLNASLVTDNGEAVDTTPLFDLGVPQMKNLIRDTPTHDYYFAFHHSAGDSMTMMNPDEMDSNVLGIASVMYILADLETSLR